MQLNKRQRQEFRTAQISRQLHFTYSKTMTYQEFIQQFKLQTKSLSYHKQIALAISVCNRLCVDYQKFSEDNNWGNPDLILDTIRFIEESKDSGPDARLIKEKIAQVDDITPDTEDFGDAIYALNTCVAICETLNFLADHRAEHIYAIGTCLTDNIDFKIQEDVDLDEGEIDSNPKMVEARSFLVEMSR